MPWHLHLCAGAHNQHQENREFRHLEAPCSALRQHAQGVQFLPSRYRSPRDGTGLIRGRSMAGNVYDQSIRATRRPYPTRSRLSPGTSRSCSNRWAMVLSASDANLRLFILRPMPLVRKLYMQRSSKRAARRPHWRWRSSGLFTISAASARKTSLASIAKVQPDQLRTIKKRLIEVLQTVCQATSKVTP
jgi:hypothetical protein